MHRARATGVSKSATDEQSLIDVTEARLAEIGGRPMLLTPDEMGKLWVTDTERWAKVVKFAGVKAE